MAEAVEKVNLLGMTLPNMIEWFEAMGEKKFRAVQVMKWIHAHGVDDFEQMTDVSKKLREKLQRVAEIRPPEVIWQKDSVDGTRKWVMRMDGGSAVETVFIPEDDRGTLCVSSQIGCALDCSFCSTGKQGFSRDLTASEIIGQVWLAAKSFDKPGQPRVRRVTNVVMMGMGEPLMNYRPVVDAMHLMLEDNAYGISKRRVTLSTSGVVPEIEKLGDEIDVALALSLHAPNDELRNKLVPLNRKYPLELVLKTCREYLRKCGDSKKRVLTVEYTMMNEVNDEIAHAEQMANVLSEIPCKINLIPFNPFPNSGYERPSNNRIHRFRDRLTELGYNVTIRKTRGDDIDAACGQLAGQVQDRTRRQERFIKLVEAGGTAADRDLSKG